MDLGQRIRVFAGKCVFRMEFGVSGLVRMICVVFIPVVVVCMIIMPIVVLICMVIMPMVIVTVVVLIALVIVVFVGVMFVFAFQFGLCLDHGAGRRIRHDEQVKRRVQDFDGPINRGKVGVTFRSIFEPDDIGTRRMKLHRDGGAFNRDIQRTDTMFMGIKLARLLRQRRDGRDKSNEGECVFHVRSNLIVEEMSGRANAALPVDFNDVSGRAKGVLVGECGEFREKIASVMLFDRSTIFANREDRYTFNMVATTRHKRP